MKTQSSAVTSNHGDRDVSETIDGIGPLSASRMKCMHGFSSASQ